MKCLSLLMHPCSALIKIHKITSGARPMLLWVRKFVKLSERHYFEVFSGPYQSEYPIFLVFKVREFVKLIATIV